MAPPYPAQGNQKQYTEKPLKIFGEQYLAGAPLPIGAIVIVPVQPDASPLPRVVTPTQTFLLHDTDWVISNRYTGKPIEVISDEEMTERFGGAADGT